VQDGQVKLIDVGSKNGTFVRVNGSYVKVPPDYILAENEWALLGTRNAKEAVRLSYNLHSPGTLTTADTTTIFGTFETQVDI
jgi:pSer/pThr/pTyr-binding forkhead associated (FHA) protein